MIIQWLGQSSFKITTKNIQGEFTVVTDPFKDSTENKMPKLSADIITLSTESKDDFNSTVIKNASYIINNPGEYETNGVFVYGINSLINKEKSTIYKIFSEEISLLHLNSLTEPLNNEQLDRVGNVDVLFLLIDEKKYENKKISELITQIEPRLVIPMFKGKEINQTLLNDLAKSCGLKTETLEKLKLLKKDLTTEETRMIILQK